MVKKVIPRKANPDLLAAVEICDDPVEYTIRCLLALSPGLNEALAREAEEHVRNVLGETPDSRRKYHQKRNEAIRRDYRNGERLVTKYIKGHARMEWVKPNGRRNEALDCAVYAYAAAIWVGIERWTEVQWARIEDVIAPSTRDLFSAVKADDLALKVQTVSQEVVSPVAKAAPDPKTLTPNTFRRSW